MMMSFPVIVINIEISVLDLISDFWICAIPGVLHGNLIDSNEITTANFIRLLSLCYI